MEQSFPLEIFRKKGITSGITFTSFLVFIEMTGTSLYHLPHHTHVPCPLMSYKVYFPKLPVKRTVPFDSPNGTTVFAVFSIQMERPEN